MKTLDEFGMLNQARKKRVRTMMHGRAISQGL
jgi:hypothetical protein